MDAQQGGMPAAGGAGPAPTKATAGQATGNQDALDKGIGSVLSKSGHGQSTGTTEKISDGVRNIFKKVTGKDVPIKDQQ